MKAFLIESQQEQSFIDQYNQELEKAESEIAKGNFYTQEEADQLLAKWEKRLFKK